MPASIWAIDGALTPAGAARVANFQASKGATGVCLPTDLQVRALGTPGGAVQVMPGGAAIENTYPAASRGQSYFTMLEEAEQLAIPATGSGSGVTRRVWQRINDPQYSGTVASATFGYGSAWPTTFPYVKLATIVQPASTATITQAMITDERKVANPLTDDVWRPKPLATPDVETLAATTNVGEYFPNNGGTQSIDIPWWATRMQVRAEWLQVRYAAGNAFGQCWLEWGPYAGASQRQYSTQLYQWDTPAASNVSRGTWIVVDDLYIPAAMRNTTQLFVQKARRQGGVANSVSLDAMSGVSLQVRFLQVADHSTS